MFKFTQRFVFYDIFFVNLLWSRSQFYQKYLGHFWSKIDWENGNAKKKKNFIAFILNITRRE